MSQIKHYALILLFCVIPALGIAQINELPRSIPEIEGVESKSIIKMIDTLTDIPNTEIHHLMILRHGKVIAEFHPTPYKAEYKHALYSVSKTFVSMAIGIAIDENRLRVTDRVASFFPEMLPDTISQNLAAMTVRDLLTMTSGINPDWVMRNFQSNWIKTFLAKPVNSTGNYYRYDSMCTFMLSAIIQRVTGKTTLEYLKPRFFEPMNIKEVDWEVSPDGISTGGWGLRLQAESLAKIGVMMLNKGEFNGAQIVPRKWIEEATACRIDNTNGAKIERITDSNQGYGYQIWRCSRPGSFRADGAYGQFIVSIPDKDMVVVINGNSIGNGDKELNTIWNVLIPGVRDNEILNIGKDYNKLQKLSNDAQLKFPNGDKKSKRAKNIMGKSIILSKNKHGIKSLSISEDKKGAYNLSITNNDGSTYSTLFSFKSWNTNETDIVPPYSINALNRLTGLDGRYVVSGAYAWNSKNKLTMIAHYANLISSRTFTFIFNENNVEITISENFSTDSKEVIRGEISPN